MRASTWCLMVWLQWPVYSMKCTPLPQACKGSPCSTVVYGRLNFNVQTCVLEARTASSPELALGSHHHQQVWMLVCLLTRGLHRPQSP
jgi:hypothetical protein